VNHLIHAEPDQILVFTLDDLSYALPLNSVAKVIPSVEIRPLPESPEVISGIINVRGRIIPVANLRKRMGLAEHEIDPDDKLIIGYSGKREVGILVDSVAGIRDLKPGQLEAAGELLPLEEQIKGVAKVDDGIILIYNLDRFLSYDQERQLDKALKTEKDEL
jgi:purine-binding chemotaxis protein CheW